MYWPSLDIITVEPVEPNMFVLCSHCLAIIFAFVECLEEISCSLHPGHDSGIQASGLSNHGGLPMGSESLQHKTRWNMLELQKTTIFRAVLGLGLNPTVITLYHLLRYCLKHFALIIYYSQPQAFCLMFGL
jgi:hypothetical protein